MKIKRNCTFLSKQINFFLIRIVLCLFTSLNTSYAISNTTPTDLVKLVTEEVKNKSILQFPRDSCYLVSNIRQTSTEVEGDYVDSNEYLSNSLRSFMIADVLYGLTFLPFRFTKNHIFRNIIRSFAKFIFLNALFYADKSFYFTERMTIVKEEMNDMNNKFNKFNDLNSDLNSDLKIFLLGAMPKFRDVYLNRIIDAINHPRKFPTKFKSIIIQIQTGSLLLCAIGSLYFAIIPITMFYSWVVTRITKLPSTPRNYDSYILFSEVMILLGCNICATSLLLVRKQNVEGGIIFIDWLKNTRRVAAISVLDDILSSPKAQDLLKSSNLNMERNSSDYNRMFKQVFETMYTDYDSIREYGERDTHPYPSYYD